MNANSGVLPHGPHVRQSFNISLKIRELSLVWQWQSAIIAFACIKERIEENRI